MIWIIIGAIIFFVILYFIIRFAVRDGIMDAHNIANSDSNKEEEGHSINKVICSGCNKKYDMDYPKCPYCKHQQ